MPDAVDLLLVDVGEARVRPGRRDLRVQPDHVDAELGEKPGVLRHLRRRQAIEVADHGPEPDRLAGSGHKAAAVRREAEEPGLARLALVQRSEIEQRAWLETAIVVGERPRSARGDPFRSRAALRLGGVDSAGPRGVCQGDALAGRAARRSRILARAGVGSSHQGQHNDPERSRPR